MPDLSYLDHFKRRAAISETIDVWNIGGGAGGAGEAFAPPTFSKNLYLNITDFL